MTNKKIQRKEREGQRTPEKARRRTRARPINSQRLIVRALLSSLKSRMRMPAALLRIPLAKIWRLPPAKNCWRKIPPAKIWWRNRTNHTAFRGARSRNRKERKSNAKNCSSGATQLSRQWLRLLVTTTWQTQHLR